MGRGTVRATRMGYGAQTAPRGPGPLPGSAANTTLSTPRSRQLLPGRSGFFFRSQKRKAVGWGGGGGGQEKNRWLCCYGDDSRQRSSPACSSEAQRDRRAPSNSRRLGPGPSWQRRRRSRPHVATSPLPAEPQADLLQVRSWAGVACAWESDRISESPRPQAFWCQILRCVLQARDRGWGARVTCPGRQSCRLKGTCRGGGRGGANPWRCTEVGTRLVGAPSPSPSPLGPHGMGTGRHLRPLQG